MTPLRILRRERPPQILNAANVHPLLRDVFASRGITDPEELKLGLAQLLPPDGFLGLGAAATMLADAMQAQSRILFVGDFDADGATSIAVGVSLLRAMGAKHVDYMVPNRFEFGYGLTPEIVDLAVQRSPDIIVTVDNGISSLDGVARANTLGIKTLITDHHLPGPSLPEADVIVNPNQPGCSFASKNLAGVGVIFYVMSALRRVLQERKWFEQQGLTVVSLASALDLVALGTVADVVPLDRNNRILVQQGLMRIRAGETRPGIRALLEVAGRSAQRLVASDLGFGIAPRLNAAGRLDDMSIGIACLLADDVHEARSAATELDSLNTSRQHIEKTMQEQAQSVLAELQREGPEALPKCLCLYQQGWHQGVVGILASRVKDAFHRPVIAFADGDAEILKGSARSIRGLHIRDALERVATENPGLIDKFGGHAMAAGLSLERSKLETFKAAFESVVNEWLSDEDLLSVLYSDGALESGALSLAVASELRYAAPWGQQFPEPVFDGRFTLVQQRIVGERHLKVVLSPSDDDSVLVDGIAFGIDTERWPDETVTEVHIAYRLDCNYFRGEETLQLMIEDLQVVTRVD